MYHCSRIRKSLFMVWFSINGQNIDLQNCFPGVEDLLVFDRASCMGEKVSRWIQSALQHYIPLYRTQKVSIFIVWSTKNGKNVDWRSWANCFSSCWRILWYVLECLPRADMLSLRWSQSALIATAMGQENVYLCYDTVKMAKVLTGCLLYTSPSPRD